MYWGSKKDVLKRYYGCIKDVLRMSPRDALGMLYSWFLSHARFLGHSLSSSLAFYLTPRHRTKLQSHYTREASVDRLIKWLGSFAIACSFAGFINCDQNVMIFAFCAAACGTNIVARERQCTIDASMPLAMCQWLCQWLLGYAYGNGYNAYAYGYHWIHQMTTQ